MTIFSLSIHIAVAKLSVCLSVILYLYLRLCLPSPGRVPLALTPEGQTVWRKCPKYNDILLDRHYNWQVTARCLGQNTKAIVRKVQREKESHIEIVSEREG